VNRLAVERQARDVYRRAAAAGRGVALRRGVRALVLISVGFLLARLAAPGPPPVARRGAPAGAASSPAAAYVEPSPCAWEVRAAQEARRLEAEFGADRFTFVTEARPFLLAIERGEGVGDGAAERYARVLRDLSERFLRTFRAPLRLGELEAALPVLIFRSPGGEVAGRYDYGRGRILMRDDPREGERVLAHEAVHQLVDAYRVAKEPDAPRATWFHEGVAMLFEAGGDPARGNPARRAGWPGRPTIPLLELTGLTTEDFWRRASAEGPAWARDCYAESWGLAYYLLLKHRAAFHTLFRLELEGRGGAGAFEQAIRRATGVPLESFEAEWSEFMRSLP
jgi:hypothetical protein